jgi:hypothetical protein
MAIHLGLSTVTKCPEFELEQSESDRLAKAAEGVARHYNIEASEKALAWTNLTVVAFSMYTPRIVALKLRFAMDREERRMKAEAQNPMGATVHPLRPGA